VSTKPGAGQGLQFRVDSIVHFLEATLRAIRTNGEIRTFLSNVTGGNTRLVIELITAFCGSPNVDSEKIVRIQRETGDYRIPLHEFTKHSLLGDYAYYHPQSSLVAFNLFDVTSPDPREHFLAALTITYISSADGMKDNDGYVDGRRVLAEMQGHSFSEDQIRNVLHRLSARRLIETPYAHYRETEVPDSVDAETFHYRITSIGVYHVRYWMTTFAFIDAVSTDTPIFDAGIRGRVFELAASFDIADRLEKSAMFKDYLEKQWHVANVTAAYLDFVSLLRLQGASFAAVEQFVDRRKAASRS
jgi:hypothetical protein